MILVKFSVSEYFFSVCRAEGALTVRGRGMWNLRLVVSAFVCGLCVVCLFGTLVADSEK